MNFAALAARFQTPHHFRASFEAWTASLASLLDEPLPPGMHAALLAAWIDEHPPEQFELSDNELARRLAFARPGDFEGEDGELTEERAREWCDIYGLEPWPTILRLLRFGPEERRTEIAHGLVADKRLANGESLDVLIDDGYVGEAYLDGIEEDMRELCELVDAESGVPGTDCAALRSLRAMPALRERVREVEAQRK